MDDARGKKKEKGKRERDDASGSISGGLMEERGGEGDSELDDWKEGREREGG